MSHASTLPELIVEIDGVPLSATETQGLTQVRVQQRLSTPALCELYFHAAVGTLHAIENLTPGVPLRVRVVNRTPSLFVGQVTALEYTYGATGEREICLRGYDALHRLRQRQTVQAHLDMSVAALARHLAAGSGLTLEVNEDGPRWPMIVQHRQNDLELLVETAAYSGLYLTVREQTLHLVSLAGHGSPFTVTLGEELLEARFEVNADAAASEVTATGWNPLRMERFAGRASRARSNRQTIATATAAQIGGSDRYALTNEAMPSLEHLTALAQAELDTRQASAVSLWAVAAGDPALAPGVPLQVQGVAANLNGRYVLTEATHIVDGELGYVTEVNTLPPPPRGRGLGNVATIGIVIQVDDREQAGRIRVKLPTFHDVESDWLAVLLPAAGPKKGFIALPDVGDTVLVLFPHNSPGQGIVLGGLYGMQRLPDSGVTRNAVRRHTWVTPGGQKIQLDDDRDTIRLENASGSYIELNRDDIIIAGQAIDLRRS